MRADARGRPGRPKARHGICAVLCTWHQNHGVYIVFLHTTIQKHWYIEWASARVPPTPSSLGGVVNVVISAASLQAARRVSENRKAHEVGVWHLWQWNEGGSWTPIRSHWCRLGVPVGCGSRHAKRMFKRLKGLKRVTPRERQAGPLRRSHGCGLGVAFACAVVRSEIRLQSFKGFKPFKRLRAGKRPAWTPIRSHWCRLGVPVGCGSRHAKRMFKRLKGLKRVMPRERQAGLQRRSHGCGLGVAFARGCAVGRSEKRLQSFKGFKPFKRWRPGKRQAWTPIRSHEGFKACNALRTAGWTAQKKPWMWPWGSFCLRGWTFQEAFAKF